MTAELVAVVCRRPRAWPNSCAVTVQRSYVDPILKTWLVLKSRKRQRMKLESISVPIRRYDGVIVAAINMGAHVDRVSSAEMIERFLPRLQETAASVKSMLM